MNDDKLTPLNLSTADLAGIDAGLQQLQQKLTDFAGTLAQRDQLLDLRLGTNAETFCRESFAALAENLDLLPLDFDLGRQRAELDIAIALRIRRARLEELAKQTEEVEMALGGDLMLAASEASAILVAEGRAQHLQPLQQSLGPDLSRIGRLIALAPEPGPTRH